MVATAKLLKVDLANPQSVAKLASYYTANTNANYYTESGDPPGTWFGDGAKALRLSGNVTTAQFENVLIGKSPNGEAQLVGASKPRFQSRQSNQKGRVNNSSGAPNQQKNKTRAEHVPGIEICFSAIKDASVLWALSDEKMKHTIERLWEESIKEGLSWFESQVSLARRGKGGAQDQRASLVIAMFNHYCARNDQNPQIHTHCVIGNMCIGKEDGKVSKVNSRAVFKWVRALGPIVRNSFIQKMDEAFGIEATIATRDGKEGGKPEGWSVLEGIPGSIKTLWSSRRREILAEADLFSGKHGSSVKARQSANTRTRRPKAYKLSNPELRDRWIKEARAIGVDAQCVKDVIGRHRAINVENRVELALRNATELCLSDRAYFTRQKFIQKVSEELQDVPINGLKVIEAADKALQQKDIFHSICVGERKEELYTTVDNWKLEQQLLSTLDRLKEKRGPKVSHGTTKKVLEQHSMLSSEQASAVKRILEEPGAVKCLTGVAGAGKTCILEALKEAYEASGYRVRGTAVSGVAKEGLSEKVGIEARTVESYRRALTKRFSTKLYEHAKHHFRMFYRELRGKRTWRKVSPKLQKKDVLFLAKLEWVIQRRSSSSFLTQTELEQR